jgi:hypothetical protein
MEGAGGSCAALRPRPLLNPSLGPPHTRRIAAQQAGAKTVKDMGKVMKAVQAKAAGRADNKLVSTLVKEVLQG